MGQTDNPSMQRWNKYDKTFFFLIERRALSIYKLIGRRVVFSGSLDAIHGFELTQSLHGVDMLLLRGSLDPVGLAVILLLSLHQRLLLGSFHPPGDSRHVEGLHVFALLVLGGCDVGSLDSGHHRVHQVLCGLNEGHGAVQPRDDQLSSQVLHLSLDFAADVELVTIQGNTLQVGQQVLLTGGVRAIVSDGAAQLVHS